MTRPNYSVSKQLSLPAVPSKLVDHLGTELPSVTVYKKYGIRISEMYYCLHNIWNIHTYKPKSAIVLANKIYWSADYLKTKVKDGTIKYQGRTYAVVYKGITPAQLTKHEGQLALSFRVAAPEFNLYPVVLAAPAASHKDVS